MVIDKRDGHDKYVNKLNKVIHSLKEEIVNLQQNLNRKENQNNIAQNMKQL